MKFTKSLGLAIAFAVAGINTPVIAADDDAPAAVSRDWKRNSGGSSVNRGTAPNHRATTTNSRPQVVEAEQDDLDAQTSSRSNRDWSRSGNGGGYRNRAYENDGLDYDEAKRIARAHRESDGHVRLRRYGHNEYETPHYVAPRRQHWWSYWW